MNKLLRDFEGLQNFEDIGWRLIAFVERNDSCPVLFDAPVHVDCQRTWNKMNDF